MFFKSITKKSGYLLKEIFKEFIADDVLKMSASLSYYTIFSLPPLLIIIISLCGFFFGAEAVRGELFGQINGLVGNDAAMQIQETIKNVKLSNSNSFATIIGVIILLFGATGVFAEIQDSLNYIWGLKAKPKRGFIKFLKNRLMSFSMIGSVGFLLLVGLSSVAIVYYGGMMVVANEITYGNVAEFIIYVNMLMWPVGSLGWVITLMQRADASQRRINEFLHTQPAIVDVPDSTETNVNADIAFENVSYRFPNTEAYALKNLNFIIRKGETLAILGTTGSGKSTLANLLVRLIESTEGTIKINNVDIRKIKLNHLRNKTGYVPQDVLLFSDTIHNNIAFGLHDVNTPFEKITAAAKAASVYDDIVAFKSGFETILGERGISLSGGQKQRVSIARALIKTPDILLLDDCLSAVDTQTEEHIMQNLSEYFHSRTTIILGHRISSVKYADRIFVLDKGNVVEEGNHQSLMNKKGLYARINESKLVKESLLA